MSNMGLDIAMKKHGIKIEKTRVGDRYVLEKMLADGYVLGGEQSGHVILLDYNTTGDGLITAVQVISAMVQAQRPLSRLAGVMQMMPQSQYAANVDDKKKYDFDKNEKIKQKIAELELKYKGQGPSCGARQRHRAARTRDDRKVPTSARWTATSIRSARLWLNAHEHDLPGLCSGRALLFRDAEGNSMPVRSMEKGDKGIFVMKRSLAALVLLIILACALSCAHAQEIPEDILDWMTEHGYENESWHSLQFDLPDGSACAFLLNDWSLYGFLPRGRRMAQFFLRLNHVGTHGPAL